MKRSHRIALGIAASIGLGLGAAAAIAHPGMILGGPMGMHGMGGTAHGPMGAGPAAAQQLMTPEEQRAMIEKMQNAKTPDERQKLAEANRAEMEKRAKEKGITLPQVHGPHAGFGPQSMPPFAAPAR
jgi:Spy/CpxP family protein refolding chaperone